MKKNRYLFCVIMFLFFVSVFSGTSLADSKTPSGLVIQNFNGDVAVRPGSSDKWEPVKEPNFRLKNGSTIRTAQGSAEISCPDGAILKFDDSTTAALSIAEDGRVQINTTQGSVNATLRKGSITTQIGPDQILQEKYNPKTADIDISCVNGSLVLTMSNGAKVALTRGDVITLSLKDKSVKVQDGTVEVAKGKNKRVLSSGSQIDIPRRKPFYVRQFPVVRGRYGNMVNPLVTNGEYAYTEDYYSQQEASPAEKSATDKEEVSLQENQEADEGEDAESIEGESLQQDDRESPSEQGLQETEASGSDAADSDETTDAGQDDNSDNSGGDGGGGE